MGKNCINLNQIWWFQSLILGFLNKMTKSPILSTLRSLQAFIIFRKSAAGVSAKLTPFENAQRWTGKNTFHFLLLNDDNMIGEH